MTSSSEISSNFLSGRFLAMALGKSYTGSVTKTVTRQPHQALLITSGTNPLPRPTQGFTATRKVFDEKQRHKAWTSNDRYGISNNWQIDNISSTIGEGNIKAPQYLPFVWESTDHRWIYQKRARDYVIMENRLWRCRSLATYVKLISP